MTPNQSAAPLPILANADLFNPAHVEEFFSTIFKHVDWQPGQQISLLGIGEKGTIQEGVFKAREVVPPGFIGVAHGHLKRWAEWHVAGFTVPAVLAAGAGQGKGGGALDKVVALTAIILDLDSGDVNAKAKYVIDRLGKPTMMVASGGRTETGTPKGHLLWLLNEPSEEVERVAGLRKMLAAKVGGDQSFGRATQVIRIPGSVHAKNGKASPCRIIQRNDVDYSLDDLAEIIENMEPMPGLPVVQNTLPMLTSGMMDFSPKQDTAIAALGRDIHEGGTELTRWSEFSKVAGFHIAEARAGRVTPQEAYEKTQGWMLTHMDPVWPAVRFDQEFRGLLNKDQASHGPMPSAPGTGEAWPDPAPLRDELPTVAPFHPDMLPSRLRGWVVDIATRMSLPLDMVAIPAMVAAGSVIGRRVGIRPQENTDWIEVGNLWGCVVAPPGFLKSPAASEALKPLRRLETKAAADFKEAMVAHVCAEELHKIEKEAAAGAAKKAMKDCGRDAAIAKLSGVERPSPPVERRYLTSDATAEKLGEICLANPEGVMVHRDEVVSLFADLEREEKASARGFFLSAWNGQEAYTFDRIGRGTLRIPALNVSLFGTTQPHRLASYIRDSLRRIDDGMVQRLQLLAWPDFTGDYVEADRWPDSEARTRANECFDYLASIDTQEIRAEVDDYGNPHAVPFLRFDGEALAAFRFWRDSLEKRVRSDELSASLRSHFAKYRGLIPRLALICHLAGDGEGPVTGNALQQALRWADYLESHAHRAYASLGIANAEAARAIWRRVELGQVTAPFTARDIHRKGWSGLADIERVKAGLEALEEADWIASEKTETRGRPAVIYRTNPKALKNA
jgi:Protein of unknown function (DUF3987)